MDSPPPLPTQYTDLPGWLQRRVDRDVKAACMRRADYAGMARTLDDALSKGWWLVCDKLEADMRAIYKREFDRMVSDTPYMDAIWRENRWQ